MPIYYYVCPQCKEGQDQFRFVDLRFSVPMCEKCDLKTELKIQAVAMLGREKPGSITRAIDAGNKVADGDASVYAGLREAERIGGNHWSKVKADHDPDMLKESRDWGKANGA